MAKGHPCPEHCKEQFSEQYSGEGNPFFGKSHTNETKAKISKANTGRLSGEKNPTFGGHTKQAKLNMSGESNGMFKGYWIVDDNRYASLDEAAKVTGLPRYTIYRRTKANKPGFSFEHKEINHGEEANCKKD